MAQAALNVEITDSTQLGSICNELDHRRHRMREELANAVEFTVGVHNLSFPAIPPMQVPWQRNNIQPKWQLTPLKRLVSTTWMRLRGSTSCLQRGEPLPREQAV